MTTTTHACPAPGEEALSCCGIHPIDMPIRDQVSADPREITCRIRAHAELTSPLDRGESPFGWSEQDPDVHEQALAAGLTAVHRLCTSWTQPTTDAHPAVCAAARRLLELIEHYAPGLDAPDPDEAAQRPGLLDRIAATLLTTPNTLAGDRGPSGIHGDGGHRYDARCALCTADVEALAAALTHTVTHTP